MTVAFWLKDQVCFAKGSDKFDASMSDRLLAAQPMVVALPWQYGSSVIVGSTNTADDLDIHSDRQGRVLPPGAETLEAWVPYIFVSLEERWSLDGGWSP